MPVIAIDEAAVVHTWNPAAELAFGWSEREAKGKTLPTLIANDPLTSWKLTNHVLSGHSLLAVEVTLLRKDRTRLLARLSASPIVGSDGTTVGAVVVFGKVHDQTRLEEALRQAEEREQLLTHFASDLVIYAYRLQPTLHLEYLSPSATRLLGISASELLAHPRQALRLLHEDDRRAGLAAFLRPAEHPGAVRLRWRRRDGSFVSTEVRNIPEHDASGALVAVEGVLRDVSRYQQRSGAAAQTMRGDWADTAPVTLVEQQLDGSWWLVWGTKPARAVLGLDSQAQLKEPLADGAHLHPADLTAMNAALCEAAKEGRSAVRARWLCADGSYHTLAWQCTALASDSPDTGRIVASILDLEPPRQTLRPACPPAAAGSESDGSTVVRALPTWRRVVLEFPGTAAMPLSRPSECPHCGCALLQRHQVTKRRVVAASAGEAHVVRYRCTRCGRTFSQRPAGVGRGVLSGELGLLVTVLYGLGLSGARISQSLAEQGVKLAPRTAVRVSGELGRSLRQSRPAGLACIIRGQSRAVAGCIAIVEDLALAADQHQRVAVELRLCQRGDTVSDWLARSLTPLGISLRSLPPGAPGPTGRLSNSSTAASTDPRASARASPGWAR